MKKDKKNIYIRQSGFTLIELLVTIAIIGVLAGVIMGSLKSAREKGADNAIKADLKSIPAQTEIFASSNNFSFMHVCDQGYPESIYPMVLSAANKAHLDTVYVQNTGDMSMAVCNYTARTWAVEIPLLIPDSSGNPLMFCVDSKGYNDVSTVTIGNTTTCRAN